MTRYERDVPTRFRDVIYRSQTVAFWAALFNVAGVAAEYRPTGFVFPCGERIVPDFFLTDANSYIEIQNGDIQACVQNRLRMLAVHLGRTTTLIEGAPNRQENMQIQHFRGASAEFDATDKIVRARTAASAIGMVLDVGRGEPRVRRKPTNLINQNTLYIRGELAMQPPVARCELEVVEAQFSSIPLVHLEPIQLATA